MSHKVLYRYVYPIENDNFSFAGNEFKSIYFCDKLKNCLMKTTVNFRLCNRGKEIISVQLNIDLLRLWYLFLPSANEVAER